MGLLEKKKAIEDEIAKTQKNKATEYHLGKLKGKLAQIKKQVLENSTHKAGSNEPNFEVRKKGNVRVALVGLPSVGKSSFLNRVTKTHSVAASYDFTTLTCIPGMYVHKGTEIQILDLPGIVDGAVTESKGRGRQVVSTARTADLILMMIDATQAEQQRRIITKELSAVGIRLNRALPHVYFRKFVSKGSLNIIRFSCTCPTPLQNGLSEELVKELLKQMDIYNAEVILHEDCTVEDFLDVIGGSARSIPCLYAYNKIDCLMMDEVDRLARLPCSGVLSLQMDLNVEQVKEDIWSLMDIVRVYGKPKNERPDFLTPHILRSGRCSVEDLCNAIHKDMVNKFRYALVWGRSAKQQPQQVGIQHKLMDEDVVQILTTGVSA
ncbi:GTP-binding protein [Perkinsela sp. CCAP 1560/4]|nr:GTP-binding protein [Perkinsela sp. CCAP 1560/4]|eukprot:KNH09745.1 GTP-binding protein [Perkinsela sp. CCAP 1560/4]